jgi:hypothetical protein
VASSNRYRRHLAAERDAAAVYRALAAQREGEEAAMFARLAEAEDRHAAYWRARLGETDVRSHRLGLRARALSWMARRVGSLIVLSLLQRAELRNEYQTDAEAPTSMAADEQVHARVVAGLARRRRAQASGPFRAAVFGVNDGLVSNLSLVGQGDVALRPSDGVKTYIFAIWGDGVHIENFTLDQSAENTAVSIYSLCESDLVLRDIVVEGVADRHQLVKVGPGGTDPNGTAVVEEFHVPDGSAGYTRQTGAWVFPDHAGTCS